MRYKRYVALGMKRTPNVERDPLHASTDFWELFRYKKAGRTRIYSLRHLSDVSAELSVVSTSGERILNSRKLVTFDNPDDIAPFLQDIERELREGGWLRVSAR